MLRRLCLSVAFAVGLIALTSAARAEETIGYNRQIRPILAENCFACHGPDSASRKADLRLDKRDAAVEMGAFVPGKPEESSLLERINSTDETTLMPPAETHKKLTAEQKELLAKWIAAGAEYEPHWSLIPPARPAVPTVQNNAWSRNPIDDFVLAGLEAAGLAPDRKSVV